MNRVPETAGLVPIQSDAALLIVTLLVLRYFVSIWTQHRHKVRVLNTEISSRYYGHTRTNFGRGRVLRKLNVH